MATAEQDVADLSAAPERGRAAGISYDWGNDRMPVPSVPLSDASGPGVQPASAPPGVAPQPAQGAPPARGAKLWATWKWMWIFGVTGFAVGGAAAAWYAHRMGYDWGMTAQIGGIAGMAAAAVGAMVPPLARAIWWTGLAALCGATGALALWLLTRVAPAFVDRFAPLIGR